MNPELVSLAFNVFIGITGPLAFWLALRPGLSRWRGVGYALGLLGQPLWLVLTWGQWGFFTVSLLWTAVWAQGTWETVLEPFFRRARG